MSDQLIIKPIGYIHSKLQTKFDTPHQPTGRRPQINVIELTARKQFEQALKDLEGFDRVWLVWWFHRNSAWKPQVLPPRGKAKKRGVFATRSPHRPNPIGISAVQLLKVEGRKVFVGEVDLVDGTPILDIKPYLPESDSFPDSKCGWLTEVQAQYQQEPSYSVIFSQLAKEQLDWLTQAWQVNFIERATELLSRDPSPHRTRRISKFKSGFKMGCGAWRIIFSIDGNIVLVEQIETGFPDRLLHGVGFSNVPDREAQIAFNESWRDMK